MTTEVIICVILAVCVIGTVIWALWERKRLTKAQSTYARKMEELEAASKKYEETTADLTEKSAELNETLHLQDKVVQQYKQLKDNMPDLAQNGQRRLDEQLTMLEDYLMRTGRLIKPEQGEAFFMLLHKSIKALTWMQTMQKEVTFPFIREMEKLQTIDPENVAAMRACLMKMAMRLFDMADSFGNVNARNEQQYNIALVKGELSEEEALKHCKVMTRYEHETPRWTRSILQAVEGWGLEDAGVIFSGYKLKQGK